MNKYLFLILLSFGIFQTQAGAQDHQTEIILLSETKDTGFDRGQQIEAYYYPYDDYVEVRIVTSDMYCIWITDSSNTVVAQETVTSSGSSVIPAPVGEGEYTLHIRSGFISLAGRFVKS